MLNTKGTFQNRECWHFLSKTKKAHKRRDPNVAHLKNGLHLHSTFLVLLIPQSFKHKPQPFIQNLCFLYVTLMAIWRSTSSPNNTLIHREEELGINGSILECLTSSHFVDTSFHAINFHCSLFWAPLAGHKTRSHTVSQCWKAGHIGLKQPLLP